MQAAATEKRVLWHRWTTGWSEMPTKRNASDFEPWSLSDGKIHRRGPIMKIWTGNPLRNDKPSSVS